MLESIWFLLWGILWAVYFMLDGFDFGVGMLYRFLGKTEDERNEILASITPFWDGNEVWLITAGGVTFAAFPAAYAVLFSALYSPLMLVLFALIIRAISLDFREKVESRALRSVLNAGVCIGSFLPALLFGVAFANIFMGIPIDAEGAYHGTILTLLNPYGLAGGFFFLLLFAMHGALWLAQHTELSVSTQAGALAKRMWLALAIATVLFLLQTFASTNLWANYSATRLLLIVPGCAVGALFAIHVYAKKGYFKKAFYASSVLIGGAVLFGVLGLFPNLLPSTLNPAYNLTIHNAASTPLSLGIMLAVALIFIPLVIVYQAWAYRALRTLPQPDGASSGSTVPERNITADIETPES